MFEPKRISKEVIPAALDKALRYRLLNEPLEAESICHDILAIEPNHQQALVTLLLALTDQFDSQASGAHEQAKALLERLESPYEQAYYEGIIHERWGKALLDRGVPHNSAIAWIREAMRCYEKAEPLSPADDPDAVLRFNTCLRILERHAAKASHSAHMSHDVEAAYGDDVPLR